MLLIEEGVALVITYVQHQRLDARSIKRRCSENIREASYLNHLRIAHATMVKAHGFSLLDDGALRRHVRTQHRRPDDGQWRPVKGRLTEGRVKH